MEQQDSRKEKLRLSDERKPYDPPKATVVPSRSKSGSCNVILAPSGFVDLTAELCPSPGFGTPRRTAAGKRLASFRAGRGRSIC